MADLQQARARGYEPSDVSVRAVLLVALGLLAAIGLSAVLLGGLLDLFEAARTPASLSPLERVELVPPPPRLEVRPLETLEQVRRRENALLEGYGWIDRERGLARIPIERAMAILAERGWPEPAAGIPTMVRHAPPFPTVPQRGPDERR